MKKVTYAKFNRERLPNFQVGTFHFTDQGIKKVEKRPLTPEGEAHIEAILQNSLLLNKTYQHVNVLTGVKENKSIVYPYVEGMRWDKLLFEQFASGRIDDFHHTLREYWDTLVNLQSSEEIDFEADEEFQQIFGKPLKMTSERCLQPANIDLILENVIIDDSGVKTIIDCEWVFDFKIPLKFIFFRGIYSFWIKYQVELQAHFSLFDLVSPYAITEEMLTDFLDMEEKHFQFFVNGADYRVGFHGQYVKPNYSLQELYANKASQTFNIKLFYENEGAYDEEHSLALSATTSNGFQKHSFKIDTRTLFADLPLRLDPFDRAGWASIQAVEIHEPSSGKEMTISDKSELQNLFSYNDQVHLIADDQNFAFFALTEDPQLFVHSENWNQEMLGSELIFSVYMRFATLDEQILGKIHAMYEADKNDRVDALSAELQERDQQIKEAELNVQQLNQQFNQQLSAAEQKRVEVQQQLSQVQHELNELLQSKSWRITKPLRSLMNIFAKRKI